MGFEAFLNLLGKMIDVPGVRVTCILRHDTNNAVVTVGMVQSMVRFCGEDNVRFEPPDRFNKMTTEESVVFKAAIVNAQVQYLFNAHYLSRGCLLLFPGVHQVH